MPRQDGTGPQGMGSLTGRGFGPCKQGTVVQRCFRRFGAGRGFRWRTQIPAETVELSKTEKKKILEAELKEIETEGKEIKDELSKLK